MNRTCVLLHKVGGHLVTSSSHKIALPRVGKIYPPVQLEIAALSLTQNPNRVELCGWGELPAGGDGEHARGGVLWRWESECKHIACVVLCACNIRSPHEVLKKKNVFDQNRHPSYLDYLIPELEDFGALVCST